MDFLRSYFFKNEPLISCPFLSSKLDSPVIKTLETLFYIEWVSLQCSEVRFASFLSGGFITAIVVSPPESKLAKRTSVQWSETKIRWSSHCEKSSPVKFRAILWYGWNSCRGLKFPLHWFSGRLLYKNTSKQVKEAIAFVSNLKELRTDRPENLETFMSASHF